ncbi:MAG: aminopeptidase [Verrucomicrobiota bacterium]|jgi:hypothetical protein
MKNWKFCLLTICACAVLAGCARSIHSISNSGYQADRSYCGYHPADAGSDPAFTYRGELSEFDVLGITRGQTTSETEIAQALDNAKRVKLGPGSSILLIQSGAAFPDAPMVAELSKHFRVVPFSGLPACPAPTSAWHSRETEPQSYAKSLRLAAARGGNDIILCYWGILESEKENLPTKTISWVPGVNWLVPDETQYKRIRLKLALIDVRSGNWTVFSPEAFEDSRINRSPRRAVADQKLVASLKQREYARGVRELVRLYAQN